jgi:NADH-quinone oxidoreductase subunit D
LVVKVTPHIGYLHTGMEKIMESKRYQQAITITDRFDYLAPMSNNLAFVLSVEKLLSIDVPERTKYIRVLLTELTRIKSHLVALGTMALEIGAQSVFLYCFHVKLLPGGWTHGRSPGRLRQNGSADLERVSLSHR